MMPANMTMFFVAVVLPEALNSKVLGYKMWMQAQYGCSVGLKSPAHITLIAPFWMAAEKESVMLHATDEVAEGFEPFEITTCDFSAFKPRTIFIAVQENVVLNNVKAKADTVFAQKPEPGLKAESRPFHPHITIATRDLSKKNFAEAWPVFEKKAFREHWTATGISVLRHNTKNWDVIYTSQFQKII